jgi:hypothetical protein
MLSQYNTGNVISSNRRNLINEQSLLSGIEEMREGSSATCDSSHLQSFDNLRKTSQHLINEYKGMKKGIGNLFALIQQYFKFYKI